jgi:hypothetical protein
MANTMHRFTAKGYAVQTGAAQPSTPGRKVGRPKPVRASSGNGASTASGGEAARIYNGALMRCDCGIAPTHLVIAPSPRAANIYDAVPLRNIPPFGACNSLLNPVVLGLASTTMGQIPKPGPCTPVTQCWSNGSATEQIEGSAALQMSSNLRCSFGGLITLLTQSF